MSDFFTFEHPDPERSGSEPVEINPVDIRFSAMNLLARREHSRKELLKKLKRRFSDIAQIELEIEKLADENLQSDRRFAENFVLYRSGLGYGLMRVRQDMRERGLPEAEISQAIAHAKIDWGLLAEQVFSKKFGEQAAVDIRDKARRARFMQYRGFSGDQYRHLL